MGESFAWPEGTLYVWTGSATASALIGYAQSVNATFAYGVDNFQTLDSAYHNRYTGQRVDVTISKFYATDALTVQQFADAKTAIHAHLKHVNPAGGSGGWLLYSGALDGVSLDGRESTLFNFSLTLHANLWSAY